MLLRWVRKASISLSTVRFPSLNCFLIGPSRRLVAWALFCLVGLSACSEDVQLSDNLVSEQPFPAIQMQSLDAAPPVSIEAYKGKLVVLNVWATWCEPCRAEMPNLQQLSDSLDPERFAVIGLAQDDDDHLVREYLLDKEIHFTSFIDPNGQIATDQLGIQVFPYTLIIAPDGRFVQRIAGPREWHHASVIEILERVYQGDFSALQDGSRGDTES